MWAYLWDEEPGDIFSYAAPLPPNFWNSHQSVDNVRWGLWTPSPPFLYQSPELRCWKWSHLCLKFPVQWPKMFQAQSLLQWAVQTVHHLPVLPLLQHSFPSTFIISHLSFKSPSPSSITTSESESGSIHNMTVFFFGLTLTHLHGTIACFHSISMTSCSVIWSMSWTSPSMGWLNISAISDGTPG